MKLTRCKKIFLIIVLAAFVVLLFSSNTAFAAINSSYDTVDSVTDEALDQAFNDSSLLGLLARLIFAVGRLLEWLLGTIFLMLTGTSDFPWADKIVFNAVPLLDVNFINPHAKSFVGQPAITKVLQNTYATILTLAASFFGIVVLITAIKLVISTIAADKAKYKKAIVDWLIGFVMLFCMHYAISFIFYLNEQLVIVASKIVEAGVQETEIKAVVKLEQTASELVNNIRKAGFTDLANKLEKNSELLTTFMNMESGWGSFGIHKFLMEEKAWHQLWNQNRGTNEQYKALEAIINWALDDSITLDALEEVKNNIGDYWYYDRVRINSDYFEDVLVPVQYLNDEQIEKIFGKHQESLRKYGLNDDKYKISGYRTTLYCTKVDSEWVPEDDDWELETEYGMSPHELGSYASKGTRIYTWPDVLDDLIFLKKSAKSATTIAFAGGRLLPDLASYFRYNAYNKMLGTGDVTAVTNGDKARIQNMIMYSVLVAQSLILFIAYIKRLFYVILLAMIAPIVVVFDFFQKFGK